MITPDKFTERLGKIYDYHSRPIHVNEDVYGKIIAAHNTRNKRGYPKKEYLIEITSIPPFYRYENIKKGEDATSSVGSKRKYSESAIGFKHGEFLKSDSIMRITNLDANGIFILDNHGKFTIPLDEVPLWGGRRRKTKRAAKRVRKTRR